MTPTDLVAYLDSEWKSERVANRVKVLVVGQDKVGKTSLIKVLSVSFTISSLSLFVTDSL